MKSILRLVIGLLLCSNLTLLAQSDTDGDMTIQVIFTEANNHYEGNNEADDEEHAMQLWARDRANLDGQDWRGGGLVTQNCDGECNHNFVDYTAFNVNFSGTVPTQLDLRYFYWEDDCWNCSGGFACLGGCGGGDRNVYQSSCPCGCDCNSDDYGWNVEFNSAINVRANAPGTTDRGWFDGDGGGNTDRPQIRASVYWTPPRPDFLDLSSSIVCPGTIINLSSAGAEWSGNYRWEYRNAATGNVWTAFGSFAANQTFTVTQATDFRVRTENGGLYSQSDRQNSVAVNTASTAPTQINATNPNICTGGSTTLSVANGTLGTGANWFWYSGNCGGTLLGQGTSINVSPTSTTSYFVRAEGTCNTTACASIQINVAADPTITVNNATICNDGFSTITLNANTTGGTGTLNYQWQSAPTAGGPWTNVGPNSPNYTVGPLATTTFYQVAASNALGCAGNSNVGSVTITTPPGVAGTYGTNTWYGSTYNGNNYNTYVGYFENNTLNYNLSLLGMGATANPSVITGYTGCTPQNNDNWSLVSRRQGFPCGRYDVILNGYDDAYEINIDADGNGIFEATFTDVCCNVGTGTKWTGVLNANSRVELRLREITGNANLAVQFNNVTNTLLAGSVGNSQGICTAGVPAALTSITPASQGVFNVASDYTYQWEQTTICNDALTFSAIPGATSAGYSPGNLLQTTCFRRRATDLCGNIAYSNTITITVSNALVDVNAIQNILCSGLTNGSINTSGSGGVAPYQYAICSGAACNSFGANQASGLFTGLAAGTYRVRVTDNLGCATVSGNIFVTQPAVLTLSAPNIATASCPNAANGSITLSGAGGTPGYQYAICSGLGCSNFGSNQFGNIFPNLAVGDYRVRVTDNVGCTAFLDFAITSVIDNIAPIVAGCANNTSVSADVACGFSLPNYIPSLTISDNCLVSSVIQTPAAGTVLPIGTTTVSVTATDNSSNTTICSFDITVADTDAPIITCPGDQVVNAVLCGSTLADYLALVSFSDNCTPLANLTLTQTPTAGTTVSDGIQSVTISAADASGNTTSCTFNVEIVGATPAVKAYLQGALLGVTDSLMRDAIRNFGYLPTATPYGSFYTGCFAPLLTTEVVNPAVFTVTGNNAIVDWMLVELRNPMNSNQVVAIRSGLIQRDGDIVDIDGVSPLVFDAPPGNYYLSLRHRNHLAIMSALIIPIDGTATNVDFRYGLTPTFGVNAQTTISTPIGLFAMWAGNANGNTNVIFQGGNNDPSRIFNTINSAPGNVLNLASFSLNAYNNSDINMDGRTIFQGPNNDLTHIFNNNSNHPSNLLSLINFVIAQQLP